jgi:hypothetical protein
MIDKKIHAGEREERRPALKIVLYRSLLFNLILFNLGMVGRK